MDVCLKKVVGESSEEGDVPDLLHADLELNQGGHFLCVCYSILSMLYDHSDKTPLLAHYPLPCPKSGYFFEPVRKQLRMGNADSRQTGNPASIFEGLGLSQR